VLPRAARVERRYVAASPSWGEAMRAACAQGAQTRMDEGAFRSKPENPTDDSRLVQIDGTRTPAFERLQPSPAERPPWISIRSSWRGDMELTGPILPPHSGSLMVHTIFGCAVLGMDGVLSATRPAGLVWARLSRNGRRVVCCPYLRPMGCLARAQGRLAQRRT
jgi:hypothetical protein